MIEWKRVQAITMYDIFGVEILTLDVHISTPNVHADTVPLYEVYPNLHLSATRKTFENYLVLRNFYCCSLQFEKDYFCIH